MRLLETFTDFGRMVKFSHTLFALPFAGLASIIALLGSSLSKDELIRRLVLILVCMASARNAAMGFNRTADADIDAENPRTQNREIPSGKISRTTAWGFTLFFCFLFVGASYFINIYTFLLSFPALFIVLFYSYTKRFTWLCHFVLGLGIGIAPSGAWIAVRDSLSMIPVYWTLGLMFHIAGFDILYSTQDIDFDRSKGLYSIPSRFGVEKSLWIARTAHIISLGFLFMGGYSAGLGGIYYIFLIITAALFAAEHILVKPDDLSRVPIAFFHINASISVILFIGILADRWNDLLVHFRNLS